MRQIYRRMTGEWCEWVLNVIISVNMNVEWNWMSLNEFRMKWNESYRSHSIMDPMTAKWDFFSGITPKTPEWCQNEWSDRNFLTKGLWLEFLISSPLDQSEASILGSRPIGGLDFGPSKFDLGLKISFIPLISATFRPFWSHFWEAVSVCSNFFYFLILQFEPHSNDSRKMWMSLEWDEWLNMI